ncbi:hypothetical protein PG991_014368 [Apiospora marii]|uniref:NB-ARC domain-containing protein n=1 Tax=Apiospora marii TaxID=335849 RepID=A0ABR1R9J5_9PEZI
MDQVYPEAGILDPELPSLVQDTSVATGDTTQQGRTSSALQVTAPEVMEPGKHNSEKSPPDFWVMRAQNVNSNIDLELDDIIWIILKEICKLDDDAPKPSIKQDGCLSDKALVIFNHSIPPKVRELSNAKDVLWETKDGEMGMDVDCRFLGFTVLYTPKEDPKVDIIALHGANGHPFGSWKSRSRTGHGLTKMWLLDFLQLDIPNARVITYGYNFDFNPNNDSEAHDYCTSFLNDLVHIRSQDEAFNQDDTVRRCTKSFLFFGLPYRRYQGPDFNLIPGLMEGGRGPILTRLEDGVNREMRGFVDKIAVGEKKIVTYYERERTPQLVWDKNAQRASASGKPISRVDPNDAVFGLQKSIEKTVPVNEDHSNMVKFNSRSNETYKDVCSALKEHIKELPESSADLNSLGAPGYNQIYFTINDTMSRLFRGREEILDDMKYNLLDNPAPASCTLYVLHGQPGIGKSAIVDNYFIQHKERQQKLAQEVLNWLSRAPCHWLLVFENADDHSIALEDFFPDSTYGSIIVTSRYSQVLRKRRGRLWRKVERLDETSSALLLKDVINEPERCEQVDQTIFETVVTRLGNHPLAIVLAGAVISGHEKVAIKPIQGLLEDFVKDIDSESRSSQEVLNHIWKPFQLLIRRLETHLQANERMGISEGIMDLLHLFSYLSGADINFDIVETVIKTGELPNSVAPSSVLSSRLGTSRIREKLLLRSLRTGRTAVNFCRQGSSGNRVVASCELVVCDDNIGIPIVNLDARFDPGLPIIIKPDPKFRAFHRTLLPHIEGYQKSLLKEAKELVKAFDEFESLGPEMALRVSMAYYEAGQVAVALEQQRCVVELLQAATGTRKGMLLTAQMLLATSLHDLNGPGQRREALEIRKKAADSGPANKLSDATGANVLSDLADSLDRLRRTHSEACELRIRILEFWNRTQPDSSQAIEAKRRLARSLFRSGQKNQALLLRREICGRFLDDRGVPTVSETALDEFALGDLRDLAQSEDDKGYFVKAFELRKTVKEGYEKDLGPAHLDTLLARSELAASYMRFDLYEEAIDQRLSVFRSLWEAEKSPLAVTSGSIHPRTIKAYIDLAHAWKRRRHFEKASNMEKEALAAFEKLPEGEKEDCFEQIQDCRIRLAQTTARIVASQIGKQIANNTYCAGLKLWEDIRTGLKKQAHADEIDLFMIRNGLADLHTSFGKLRDAYQKRKDLLQEMRDVQDKPPSELNLRIYYTVLKGHAGDCDRLAKQTEKPDIQNLNFATAADLTDSDDDDIRSTVSSLSESECSTVSTGTDSFGYTSEVAQLHEAYVSEALAAWEDLYKVALQIDGDEVGRDTLDAMRYYADSLEQNGTRLDKALALNEKAINIMKEPGRYGETHAVVMGREEAIKYLKGQVRTGEWVENTPDYDGATVSEGQSGVSPVAEVVVSR